MKNVKISAITRKKCPVYSLCLVFGQTLFVFLLAEVSRPRKFVYRLVTQRYVCQTQCSGKCLIVQRGLQYYLCFAQRRQFQQLLKTQIISILNFSRPSAITYPTIGLFSFFSFLRYLSLCQNCLTIFINLLRNCHLSIFPTFSKETYKPTHRQ